MAIFPRDPVRRLSISREEQKHFRRERDKLVLTDTLLISISKRSDVLSAFPFFRLIHKFSSSGCGGCGGGNKRRQQIEDLTHVKKEVMNLNRDQKEHLKLILSVETIILYVPGEKGLSSYSF